MGISKPTLADQFDARPVGIRKFLKGRLDSERTRELGDAMRRAGLPI